MTWKEFVYKHIVEYCNRKESRTFSLQDFYREKEFLFKEFRPHNKHVLEKVRQQLQYLRNEGFISFIDNSGHYTLRVPELLDAEKKELNTLDISQESPDKKEYLIEIYVRNVMWVKQAKKILGDLCLIQKCNNTFLKEDGTRYIEVHHIIPLHSGGEDGIWNLSVLCAHHHKMAHFADINTRKEIQNYLLKRVYNMLHSNI